MFGLSTGEIIILGIVALVLFGKDDLPSTLRKFAKWFTGFKESTNDVQRSWIEMRDDVARTIMKEPELHVQAPPATTQDLEKDHLQSTAENIAHSHGPVLMAAEGTVPHGSDSSKIEEKIQTEELPQSVPADPNKDAR